MITGLQEQARRLRAQITEAFADVPYPGDDNLYDGWQLDDDYEDVIRHFTGKHWRDLIPQWKPPNGRAHPLEKDMHFCSPAAWQFFLPAYLIISLMNNEIDTDQIGPRENDGLLMRDHTAARFNRLSAEQCAVMASFCRYADTLLIEKQKDKPQHREYYEAQRHELVPATLYWNSRIEYP